MKKSALTTALIATSLVLFESRVAQARDYFVSPSGHDSAEGTKERPFRTLQAATAGLEPGDTLWLRKGTYRETLRLPRSGEHDRRITVAAYQGERATISGANAIDPASLIRTESGRVVANIPPNTSQLFLNGKALREASWPNAGAKVTDVVYEHAGKDTSGEALVVPTLPPGEWVGAYARILGGLSWVSSTRRIDAHEEGRLVFDRPITGPDFLIPREGNAFFLFGVRAALDAPGEWFADASGKLEMILPEGIGEDLFLEVRVRDVAIDLNQKSYVTLKGLEVFSGALHAQQGRHLRIEDCSFRYSSYARLTDAYNTQDPGNLLDGEGHQWLGGTIESTWGSGLQIRGSRHLVEGVTIREVAYSGGNFAGISLSAVSTILRRNHIGRSGRYHILANNSSRVNIIENVVSGACLLTEDCGSISAYKTNGDSSVIRGNRLLNTAGDMGFAIYLDDGTRGFTVSDNIIEGANTGIVIKDDNIVKNNTVLQPRGQGIAVGYNPGAKLRAASRGAKILNNRVYQRIPLRLASGGDTTEVPLSPRPVEMALAGDDLEINLCANKNFRQPGSFGIRLMVFNGDGTAVSDDAIEITPGSWVKRVGDSAYWTGSVNMDECATLNGRWTPSSSQPLHLRVEGEFEATYRYQGAEPQESNNWICGLPANGKGPGCRLAAMEPPSSPPPPELEKPSPPQPAPRPHESSLLCSMQAVPEKRNVLGYLVLLGVTLIARGRRLLA